MANSIKLSSIIFSFFFLQQLLFSNGQNNDIKGGYWLRDSGLPLNNIDSTLFTHLFCAFADLNSQSNQLIIKPEDQDSFRQFTSTVQQKNPSAKTLLSIGGGDAPNKRAYGVMARTPNSRKSFIDSSIRLARQLGFHGLDLDWEYPESATDMTNFGILLNEWRTAINTEARNSGRAPLLLTAAVFYSPRVNNLDYPVPSVARNFDWINLMAYDFYAPNWSASQTNSHAQLFDPVNHVSGSDGITTWIQAGVPTQKLVLGIPFYGYAWQLVNANIHGLRAPASGKSSVSPNNEGSITYSQIQNYIVQSRATTVYNATIVGYYCYSGNTWIWYDDTQSVRNKVTYAKGRGLLGYFAWHIAQDQNWVLSRTASQTWGASSQAMK
ncbi:class V chitinase-like [Lycium ferocissimum]|uniref:class V chitinase-like n=1 Tax=Lycium ferocissimum TaxID=112874 RepID=UPI0028153D91|nr:class V chitinase-like [Lycium ferocissimum]